MPESTKVYVVLVETYIWDGVHAFVSHSSNQAFINRSDAEALAASLQHPGCPVATDILEMTVVISPKATISSTKPVPTRGGVWKDKAGTIWRLNQDVPGTEPIIKDIHLIAIIKWAQRQWHEPDAHRRYHSRTMGEYLSFPEPNGEMAQLTFEQELDHWLEPWDGTYYPIEEVFDGLQIPYKELVTEAHSRGLNVPQPPSNDSISFLQDRC